MIQGYRGLGFWSAPCTACCCAVDVRERGERERLGTAACMARLKDTGQITLITYRHVPALSAPGILGQLAREPGLLREQHHRHNQQH